MRRRGKEKRREKRREKEKRGGKDDKRREERGEERGALKSTQHSLYKTLTIWRTQNHQAGLHACCLLPKGLKLYSACTVYA